MPQRPVIRDPQQLFGLNPVLGPMFYGLGSIALGGGYNLNSQPVPTGGATTVAQGAEQSAAAAASAEAHVSDSSSLGAFDAGMEVMQ